MEVTFSKQWIHFLRSDLWPPTSTILRKRSTYSITEGAAVLWMQRTSKQWEFIWFFTIPVNLAWGCDSICLLTKPASSQNTLVQKYTNWKNGHRWVMPNSSPTYQHCHFCCILLWLAQQQPWVWKDKSFKTVLCHMSKLFLFLIKAPACLKASPPLKSFFSCYTFVGMCCLTVTHFSLSVSSPTCTTH